jgi:hypothetical protein
MTAQWWRGRWADWTRQLAVPSFTRSQIGAVLHSKCQPNLTSGPTHNGSAR